LIFWIIFVCEKEIIEFILIVVNIFVGYYKRCAASGALLFFCFLSNTNAKMSSNRGEIWLALPKQTALVQDHNYGILLHNYAINDNL